MRRLLKPGSKVTRSSQIIDAVTYNLGAIDRWIPGSQVPQISRIKKGYAKTRPLFNLFSIVISDINYASGFLRYHPLAKKEKEFLSEQQASSSWRLFGATKGLVLKYEGVSPHGDCTYNLVIEVEQYRGRIGYGFSPQGDDIGAHTAREYFYLSDALTKLTHKNIKERTKTLQRQVAAIREGRNLAIEDVVAQKQSNLREALKLVRK